MVKAFAPTLNLILDRAVWVYQFPDMNLTWDSAHLHEIDDNHFFNKIGIPRRDIETRPFFYNWEVSIPDATVETFNLKLQFIWNRLNDYLAHLWFVKDNAIN